MENIILKKRETIQLLEKFSETSLVFGENSKVAYIVYDHQIFSLNLINKKFIGCASFESDNEDSKIIYSCYIIEDELLFILFCNGAIITYDIVNDMILKHTLDIEDVINDAKFSHDQELLVITTINNQMLLYNKLLVLKRKYNLNNKEYGANVMINVNWGSKSTQFHGPGMRDRRNVQEETVSLFELDDRKSFIEWKHDDNSFAINIVAEDGYRLLKIFDRDGYLQHTSEYVAGLAKQISWKPSGSLIAASRQTSDVHEIIFFENNGLKHGQFKLPYKPKTFIIEKLSWSYDSSILLICGFQIEFIEENDVEDNKSLNYNRILQEIMLFTQNNYHWYLKQRIKFDKTNFIKSVVWDENDYLKLHLLSSNGSYLNHSYQLCRQVTEHCNVLLIDGNKLNISDFLNTMVPPPMFTYSIEFNLESIQIKQVCYRDDYLAVFLTDDSLMIFKLMELHLEDFDKINYPVSFTFENVPDDFTLIYFPIFFKNVSRISEILHCVFDKNFQLFGCIDEFIVHFNHRNDNEIVYGGKLNFNCDTMLLLPDYETFLISNSNSFECCNLNGSSIFNQFCQNSYDNNCMKALMNIDPEGQTHLIVLTENYSLYYDDICLMKRNVDSFLLYRNSYLLFTTIDSFLYCWPLKDFNLSRCQQNYPPRSLEKGSKLLTVSYINAKVVVELPRGNLEAFYPRVLLLDNVNEYLQRKLFLKAFEILRTNRINLNYLCDYDFNLFINNCQTFIEQLKNEKIDWICLFLYELSSSNHYHILNHQSEVKIENKLNIICNRFIETMIQIDEKKYLKPIVLSHIKKEKPEIVEALNRIKNLPDTQSQDSVIEFLVKMIDIDLILDEALGTYDFDLLLMIASRSNKDPKEYNALVESFKKIEDENYRKFKIDFHLRRYKNCLSHLSKCPDKFDEALNLIQTKHLFREAIEIYDLNDPNKLDDPRFKQMWLSYADYLFKKCYYTEAAIAFKRASNYSQAYKMYVQCSNWNAACVCAKKICQDSEEDFQKMLKSLSQNLLMNAKYIDSAYINEHYLKDYNESFRVLVKGHQWEHAIRLHDDYNLEESLIENELKPEISNSYEHICDEIKVSCSQLSDHTIRLKELLEINRNISDPKFEADTDVYSDTSSICDTSSLKSYNTDLSTNTLKTNRSSQSRLRHVKKMEQKKYVLKRGSYNEDIQIIYAIKEIINKSINLFKAVPDLIRILYDLYFVDQSKTLQMNLESLENLINECIEYVWSSGLFTQRIENDELLKLAPNKINSDSIHWKIVLN